MAIAFKKQQPENNKSHFYLLTPVVNFVVVGCLWSNFHSFRKKKQKIVAIFSVKCPYLYKIRYYDFILDIWILVHNILKHYGIIS